MLAPPLADPTAARPVPPPTTTPRPGPMQPAEARAELARVLGGTRLPAFPEQHSRILDALRDESCPPGRLAEVISSDPAVAVQLLRTVNSAGFGLPRQVSSIGHAVSLMGRGRLEQLVLGLGASAALPRFPARWFDARRFWAHSARRATVAEALAARTAPALEGLCFTAGLLLQMAVPLLVKARPRTYEDILPATARGEGPLAQLERASLGVDHAELGGMLADAWGMPLPLADAIRHAPDPTGPAPLAVRLAATLGEEADAKIDRTALLTMAVHAGGMAPQALREGLEAGLRRAASLADSLR